MRDGQVTTTNQLVPVLGDSSCTVMLGSDAVPSSSSAGKDPAAEPSSASEDTRFSRSLQSTAPFTGRPQPETALKEKLLSGVHCPAGVLPYLCVCAQGDKGWVRRTESRAFLSLLCISVGPDLYRARSDAHLSSAHVKQLSEQSMSQ